MNLIQALGIVLKEEQNNKIEELKLEVKYLKTKIKEYKEYKCWVEKELNDKKLTQEFIECDFCGLKKSNIISWNIDPIEYYETEKEWSNLFIKIDKYGQEIHGICKKCNKKIE